MGPSELEGSGWLGLLGASEAFGAWVSTRVRNTMDLHAQHGFGNDVYVITGRVGGKLLTVASYHLPSDTERTNASMGINGGYRSNKEMNDLVIISTK